MLHFDVKNNYGEFGHEIPFLLKEPVIGGVTLDQIPYNKTTEMLDTIVAAESGQKEHPKEPCKYNDHVQQLDPGKFIDVSSKSNLWSLDNYMDGTSEKNSDYLAFKGKGDDIILMRRVAGAGNWPHILVKDIKVNLDTHPIVTWKFRYPKNKSPMQHAVRIIDEDKEAMVKLLGRTDCKDGYFAFNAKKILGTNGPRTLSIRFYYLGKEYVKATKSKAFSWNYAQKGDYMVIDFLRFESDK